jgi:hypothetical protein
MTPDEIDRLQRLVPSDSDAAHALWKAKCELAHCCPECDDADHRELIATFEHDWATAPSSMTTDADRSLAAYWWFKGRTAGRTEGLVQSNVDLREIMRASKERL